MIGGEWVAARRDAVPVIDPATQAALTEVADATEVFSCAQQNGR
jgi:acyl-CoA reductase-like NAD-dependent aldehyde dehydrogenase